MGNSKEGTVWEVPAGKVSAATTRLWNQLGGSGALVVKRLDENPEFLCRVAEFMRNGGFWGSTPYLRVKKIMGRNFWGPEEWFSFFGVTFTEEQLSKAGHFPWSEDLLNAPCLFVKGKRVWETHFAFLGLENLNESSLTISKWKELLTLRGQAHPQFLFCSAQEWRPGEGEFGMCELRWYLMPLDPIGLFPKRQGATRDCSKTYRGLEEDLPEDYDVPRAVEEVAKHFLYCILNGDYIRHLVSWWYKRGSLVPVPGYGYQRHASQVGYCREVVDGNHVVVGYYHEAGFDGIEVGKGLDKIGNIRTGLALSRKLPIQITTS